MSKAHTTFSLITAWLRLGLAGLSLSLLAACAENFNANVSRFQALPAPQGESFAVVGDNTQLAGSLEFAHYAHLVEAQLVKQGYALAPSPEAANLIVHFDYGVDKGRENTRSSGFSHNSFWGPWSGYGYGFGGGYGRGYGHGYGGGGFGGYYGGGFYGSGFYGGRGPWGYGWYDPFFDGGYENYTVYTSGISVKIDRKGDGKRVFEGKAEAASTSNRLSYLVPNLVEAMFTRFPGNSGETVRISVAPEKRVQH